MKNRWIKKISIVLAALLLLAALPMSALAEQEKEDASETVTVTAVEKETEAAEKETEAETGPVVDTFKKAIGIATDSDADDASASDAEFIDGEIIDGEIINDQIDPETVILIMPEEIEVPVLIAPPPEPTLPAEEASKLTADDISGLWTIDDVTSYRFDEGGTGALVLPDEEYPFDFTIEDDEITLEFDHEAVGTVVFRVSLEEEKLILERVLDSGTAEYLLEKVGD